MKKKKMALNLNICSAFFLFEVLDTDRMIWIGLLIEYSGWKKL